MQLRGDRNSCVRRRSASLAVWQDDCVGSSERKFVWEETHESHGRNTQTVCDSRRRKAIRKAQSLRAEEQTDRSRQGIVTQGSPGHVERRAREPKLGCHNPSRCFFCAWNFCGPGTEIRVGSIRPRGNARKRRRRKAI